MKASVFFFVVDPLMAYSAPRPNVDIQEATSRCCNLAPKGSFLQSAGRVIVRPWNRSQKWAETLKAELSSVMEDLAPKGVFVVSSKSR